MGGKGVHSWMDDVHKSNTYMRLEIFSQLNVWPCEYFQNWTYLQFSKQSELMQLSWLNSPVPIVPSGDVWCLNGYYNTFNKGRSRRGGNVRCRILSAFLWYLLFLKISKIFLGKIYHLSKMFLQGTIVPGRLRSVPGELKWVFDSGIKINQKFCAVQS